MNKMILRAVDVLEYASKDTNGFRISDVVRDLSIPKSSAFDIIYTLVETEMLEIKDDRLKTFSIGPKAYDIGYSYVGANTFLDIAAPILDKLSEEIGKTVFIGKFDNNEVLYVYKHQPANAILNHCTVNTRASLHCTALGKAMLAFRKQKFDFSKIEFKRFTKRTLMSAEELEADLEKTRQRGYAVDDREIKDYMICISAPVLDADGDCNYSISASTLYEDINVEELAAKIMEAANLISRKAKYLSK